MYRREKSLADQFLSVAMYNLHSLVNIWTEGDRTMKGKRPQTEWHREQEIRDEMCNHGDDVTHTANRKLEKSQL